MGLKNNAPYIFQIDSDIVKKTYHDSDNFLRIEKETDSTEKYCAIYFSSNDIYYPNTEDIFTKRIVEKNFFEWYNQRLDKAQKHIYLRDIFKQYYLTGINSRINSPEKLLSFLQEETKGYKIVTIGSSAGGYAAALYGSLLGADYVLCFNGRSEMYSKFKISDALTDPLLYRFKGTSLEKYYDLNNFLNDETPIFFFYSCKSNIDTVSYQHIRDCRNVNVITFSTSHHGIPFLKCNLPKVINLSKEKLNKLSGRTFHPLSFSIRTVGPIKTINGFTQQAIQAYKKRR